LSSLGDKDTWGGGSKFVFAKLPLVFIEGVLSPEGIKILSIFMGVELGSELALNFLYRSIAKGVGEHVMLAAAKMALEQGTTKLGIEFINNAIMTKVLTTAVQDTGYLVYTFYALKGLATAASFLMSVWTIVMIIAFILDVWDPLGLNEMIDADIVDKIIDQMNEKFSSTFLSSVAIGTDEFGRPIHGSLWPVEYYADNIIANEKKEEYNIKMWEYIVEYLSELKYNSEGQLICYGEEQKTLINNPMIEQAAKKWSVVLSDQNTVVSNWIYRLWPILIVILFLIIIFLLFIK
jgi:hypothetical protein